MRNTTLQFYLARAEQARDEADAATLEHVRERCRRSEAAWTMLADRAARSEAMREKIEKMKAAETAAMKDEDHFEDKDGPQSPRDPRDRAPA